MGLSLKKITNVKVFCGAFFQKSDKILYICNYQKSKVFTFIQKYDIMRYQVKTWRQNDKTHSK